MIDLAAALNDHELNPDLRTSFWSEWKFNDDHNPQTRIKFPLFQEVEDAVHDALKPFAEAGYRLSLLSRYLQCERNRFECGFVTPLMASTARSSAPAMKRDQDPQPISAFRACPVCHGTGAGRAATPRESRVPEPLLALHGALAGKLKAPQFAGIRGHRGGLIASGLQRIEGGQGPQKAAFHPVGPGLFQILFIGEILGFESKSADRAALVHSPDAWNYPVKFSGLRADAWNYPDNVVGRDIYLADELGVDPNTPRAREDQPWRLPCASCSGRGRS